MQFESQPLHDPRTQQQQQRASILRESYIDRPRESTDTGIDSIYNMYGDEDSLGGGRSSWLPSAEQHNNNNKNGQVDRIRPSGDQSSTLSQTVTLSNRRPHSSAPYEPSALAYHIEDETPQKLQPIPYTMVNVENSPRVSVATTSSAQAQSSYATPPSTYRYSDLFESGINASTCPTSDGSSSTNTTPAIPDAKEFADGPLLSQHLSSTHRQFLLRDLPPLPPSRQSTPSPPRKAPSTADLTPQRSVQLDTSKHSFGTPSSKVSLVPSEGEDMDGFHVRNTYAQLEASGVKGDGYEEGIERTRARLGTSRRSQTRADAALGDGSDKKRDLDDKEIHVLQRVDRYGFFSNSSHDRLILLSSGPLLKKLSKVRAGPPGASPTPQTVNALPSVHIHPKEASRISKWSRMLIPQKRQVGGNVEAWWIRPSKEGKFRERVYKGIPDRWRRAAWDFLMARTAGVTPGRYEWLAREYREALDRPSTYDVQIDLDVPRTINGHIMFRTRYGSGQRSLFHVLHAFSLHCSSCGYVQGMGPIAATLLCYFEPERVYTCLVILHDAYHLHTIFNPGFPGMIEAIYVQERLMETTMPAVYAAFKRHMISTTAYATKWYITLFANSVPFQTQLRLWDAFLLEGYDVFVAIAVAIVWVYRDHITSNSANFETALSLLSSFFVPEDEDAFMSWISNILGDKKVRRNMARWRRDWQALVAAGREGTALL